MHDAKYIESHTIDCDLIGTWKEYSYYQQGNSMNIKQVYARINSSFSVVKCFYSNTWNNTMVLGHGSRGRVLFKLKQYYPNLCRSMHLNSEMWHIICVKHSIFSGLKLFCLKRYVCRVVLRMNFIVRRKMHDKT